MKSKIRNAYQKIQVGDVVSFRQDGTIAMGTVTEKQPLGALQISLPGSSLMAGLLAVDVLGITRNGVPVASAVL